MSGNIVGIDGKPVTPPAQQASPAGQPFQPPVDPNTGQPIVNPNTGKPYTQEEFQKAQNEAMQTIELACKMLGRVFPDALIVVAPSGILHAQGEVFRLNKMCRMAADDLEKHGEMMFRRMGWGARRPGGPAPVQGPLAAPPQPSMTPQDQQKFAEEVQAAIKKQMEQAAPAGEPAKPAAEEPVAQATPPAEKENG